jgi:TonB family protein
MLIGGLAVLVIIFSIATGLISRDTVIAGQTEAKRNGVSGGVTQNIQNSNDNLFYLNDTKGTMQLNQQQISDINKDMEESPLIVIRSEDWSEAPVKILDAKIKVVKVPKLYSKDGVELIPSVDQYAVRPYITMMNNTNRRITGILLEFTQENVSNSVIFYNLPSALEPGASYESGISRTRLSSLLSNPESLVVKAVGARFDNEKAWDMRYYELAAKEYRTRSENGEISSENGVLVPPPPPPPPPPAGARRSMSASDPLTSDPPKIIRRSDGVIQSEALRQVTPHYPKEARKQGISGTVVVEITIGETGNVIHARALSGHELLEGPAVEAARQWQFKPTTVNGQYVKVVGTVSFIFQL